MEIVENKSNYLNDFIRLNEAWISKYFQIEEIDRELAANPQKIIEGGGYIFSLIENNKVIGVCALFNEGNGIYELARMTIQKEHRGNGYGGKLLEACINKLRQIGAREVYLVSNTMLKSAISLYEKYGFKTTNIGQHPVYARANITMAKQIS
ncbi:MAG: GNAT family N-acetyltransferase [Gammaproteobacteria bacterium]|nr:GNAT family N-acetyltransferase [Gammaproteobacteria bacterium]